MTLNKKQKTVLGRFVRVSIHGMVASLAAWLVSPDMADLVGSQYVPLLAIFGTAMLNAVNKALRWGNDDGEDTGESLRPSKN